MTSYYRLLHHTKFKVHRVVGNRACCTFYNIRRDISEANQIHSDEGLSTTKPGEVGKKIALSLVAILSHCSLFWFGAREL